MTEAVPEYVAARRTLLDALDALVAHRHSLILIGAQAVYLHTGSQGMRVPPMTTDADLALNVDLLADDPEIAATMRGAGFNAGQPGHWENAQGIAVDLMVAPHQSNRASLDILRLLQACSTAQLTAGLSSHQAGSVAHPDVERCLLILRERAVESNHDLPVLATRASGDDPTIAASLVVLARELLEAMS